MIANPQSNYIPPQDYLDWEATQEIKHAYVDGDVFAMTGGTVAHNLIALNLASALKAHLRGKGCRVFIADVKVEVSETGPYHYPDVMVSCDPRDNNAIKLIRYPCLIVEVLSPSTANYDRGDKFTHYRQIPTVQEYVLIDTHQISVDRYRRLAPDHWDLQTYSADSVLDLTSVDWQESIALLYEDVQFDLAEESL